MERKSVWFWHPIFDEVLVVCSAGKSKMIIFLAHPQIQKIGIPKLSGVD